MLQIYKSSAGSGKTYTLVRAYLILALAEPKAYRQILAVTFTNKATEEMKSRILKALAALANPEANAEHAAFLMEKLHIPSRIQLATRAQALLRSLLSDYTRFSVSTIEKFFQTVLRGVARELDIPIGYDILLDTAAMRQLAVARTLAQVEQDPLLRKYLADYASDKLDEGRNFRLEQELVAFSENIFQEKFWEVWEQLNGAVPTKEDIQPFAASRYQLIARVKGHLNDLIDEAISVMDAHGLTVDDFNYKGSGPAGTFFTIQKNLSNGDYSGIKFGIRAQEGMQNPDSWTSKSKPNPRAVQAATSGLQRILQEMNDFWEINRGQVIFSQIILGHVHVLGLVSNLEAQLFRFRQDQQTLVLSDANRLLQSLVRESDIPFLYEKIGTRYLHYLIDEFQDTSTGQWHNFLPLIQQSLSMGGQSLIVGDAKQSIYRWRNGNPQLLLTQVQQDLQYQELSVSELAENWRSAPNVVKFNNALFGQIQKQHADPGQPSLIPSAYAEVNQTPQKSSPVGYVEIRLFDPETPENQDLSENETWTDMAKAYTLQTIQDLVNEHADDTKNYKLSDICILVRTNNQGIVLAEYLRKNEVAVFSSESLLLNNHPPVKYLAGMLKALLDPQNPINQGEVIRAWKQIQTSNQSDFAHPYFLDKKPFFQALSIVNQERVTLLREALPMMVIALIRHLKLNESDPYLLGFVEQVQQFSTEKQEGLASFLRFWEEKKHKLALASLQQASAVQVLTIHKAKGLEFPVVLVPMISWKEHHYRDYLWSSPEAHQQADFPFPLVTRISPKLKDTPLADQFNNEIDLESLESLNMAYVAFTRACHRLYLGLPKKGHPQNFEGKLNAALEMVTDLRKLDNGYTWGEKEPKPVPTQKAEESTKLQEHPLDLGSGLLFANQNPKAFRIRRRGDFSSTEPNERKARIARGTLIHEILAACTTTQDLESALHKQIRRGRLEEEESRELGDQITQCWSQPLINDWFSGNWIVRNEAEILVPSGTSQRPDRVMTDTAGDRAVVLDYKSGVKKPEHTAQVAGYCQQLREMGYGRVSGYLLYLQDFELETVVG